MLHLHQWSIIVCCLVHRLTWSSITGQDNREADLSLLLCGLRFAFSAYVRVLKISSGKCSRLLPSVSSIAFNNQFSHWVFPKERCAYKYGCVSCYRAQICDGLHVRRRDEVARSLRSRCELLRRLRQTEVSTAKDSAELACVNGITCMTRRPTQVIGCNCTQFRSYYI